MPGMVVDDGGEHKPHCKQCADDPETVRVYVDRFVVEVEERAETACIRQHLRPIPRQDVRIVPHKLGHKLRGEHGWACDHTRDQRVGV